MSKIPYWSQLLDPRWQKKRLEVLNRSHFTCEDCSDSESTLHIHHMFYQKGLMAWEYPNLSLKALCEECHERRAEAERNLLMAFNASSNELLSDFALELERHSKAGVLQVFMSRSVVESSEFRNAASVVEMPIQINV